MRKFNYHEKPVDEVRRIVRTITNPAHRHKCELCAEVFECHLCKIDERQTHPLHMQSVRYPCESRPMYVCEHCIEANDLGVVPTNQNFLNSGNAIKLRSDTMGTRFYDHLTGERLT